VHWPYTLDYPDSYLAAQSCAALLLTALLLYWRTVSWFARGPFLAAIWLAAVATMVVPSVTALGYHTGPEAFRHVLAVSAAIAAVGCVLARRIVVSILSLAGQYPLWLASGFVKDSDGELSGLYLAWIGLLIGLALKSEPPGPADRPRPPAETSYALHDGIVFVLATTAAALVSVFVMRRGEGAADEWGYTYQAAVFAKGHIYGASPRCETFLEHMYVFESQGRLFSEYLPGWPLFLAPFVWFHAIWLGGPVSTGIAAVGVARLARSAMRAFGRADAAPSARAVRTAGTWGAVLATLGPMQLVNGGSRYPHMFTVGLYAWMLEALIMIVTPDTPPEGKRRWAIVLGGVAVLGVAVRPADGAFVALGAALVFLYYLVRGRVGWSPLAVATAMTALSAGIFLVILRVQIGRWFTTGYALNETLHPWNIVKYTKPTPAQWKYSLPLATAAYCWWPCSFGLGLAGLSMLRGRARALNVAFALGCLPYIGYMEWLDLGQRGYDWGYGPRYLMVLIVPLAIGGAVALAPLTVAARDRWSSGGSALSRGGPLALAIFAVVSCLIRVTPLVWPTVADQTKKHTAVQRAVADAHLTNAVVIATKGTTSFQEIDLTTNLPVDLYPDQDVVIAIDRERLDDAVQCIRYEFPERTVYLASGVNEIVLSRWRP
jgi:hypothetical protein